MGLSPLLRRVTRKMVQGLALPHAGGALQLHPNDGRIGNPSFLPTIYYSLFLIATLIDRFGT